MRFRQFSGFLSGDLNEAVKNAARCRRIFSIVWRKLESDCVICQKSRQICVFSRFNSGIDALDRAHNAFAGMPEA